MTAPTFSATWTALAPAVGDHLWQSTLFATVGGLLSLALGKNSARARYWLWLAASLKFFVPFVLLENIGRHLALTLGESRTEARIYSALSGVSQPFSPASPAATISAPPSGSHPTLTVLLVLLWLGGIAVVLAVWLMRWRVISHALHHAQPLREGREVDALRRMERAVRTRRRIEILASEGSLEPGVVGFFRPALLWPQEFTEHFEDVHLDVIMAHEVCHVRRRDNLAAALHMVVQGVFWFYPLVWWLGARLVEERERACDEEVLALGGEPAVYAESILRTCRFSAGFPVVCVSGVTGADLKNRIVHIMTSCVRRDLHPGKKVLLAAVAAIAITVPVASGMMAAGSLELSVESHRGKQQPVESFSPTRSETVSAVSPLATAVHKKKSACSKSARAKPTAKSGASVLSANYMTPDSGR